jgi:hypothetical protein
VANGSFETGDFTGWTVSGDTSFTCVCDVSTCPGNFMPQDGTFEGVIRMEQNGPLSGQGIASEE